MTTHDAGTVSLDDDRVFYRDVKPYEAPGDLAELVGPTAGVVALPRSVYWGPWSEVDLEIDSDLLKAYEALVREGRTSDQRALMNRDVLMRVWPRLVLPARVRALWQSRFPELSRL